jgi:S-DNA-T family DNA segregation ATPase FtsK/SpoIIIE
MDTDRRRMRSVSVMAVMTLHDAAWEKGSDHMSFEGITFIVLFVLTYIVCIIGYVITYPFRRHSSLALRVKCQVKQFPDIMSAEYINKNGRILSVTTAYGSNPVDIGTLKYTLNDLNIPCHIDKVHLGSVLNKVYMKPERGTEVSKIKYAEPDLQVAMGASNLEVTVEDGHVVLCMPSNTGNTIFFGDLIASPEYRSAEGLPLPIGQTDDHKAVIYDLGAAGHILICGAAGTGKSVLIQSMALGLLMKNNPRTLHLYIADLKDREYTTYRYCKMSTVITSADEVITLLNDLCVEMDKRLRFIANENCSDIYEYNSKVRVPMRQEVLFIDEMADIMLTCGRRAESPIVKLVRRSDACGIHLILAAQKPERNVVTGLIGMNIPTRICLTVKSCNDSMAVIDQPGGERLLGKGDMLFLTKGQSAPVRLQGGYVTLTERDNIICLLRQMGY